MPLKTLAEMFPPPLGRSAGLSAWKATAILWIFRWLVILPLNWLVAELSPQTSRDAAARVSADALSLFVLLVLVAPLVETLIECSLPLWVLLKFRGYRDRAWMFILASASVMAVLHLVSVLAVVNAFITGGFIAVVYWHAWRIHGRRHGPAVLHATVYHAAINLVGWTIVVVSRHG